MSTLSSNDLMGRAVLFGNELPDLHNVRSTRNIIVFEFVMEGKFPAAKWKYRSEYIDRYAMNACKKIFFDQSLTELAQKDFTLIFFVYFWDEDKIIGEMEFRYSLKNFLFNLEQFA
jgi:hypothetical protein